MALPVSSLVLCRCVDNVDCIAEVLGNCVVVASVIDLCFSVAAVLAKDLRRKGIRERATNERFCKKH